MVLVRKTNDQFVDQRVAKATLLVEAILVAGGRPEADDGVRRGNAQARLGDFQGDGVHVLEGQLVVGGVLIDSVTFQFFRGYRDEVHQVENGTNVDVEGFVPLSDEHASGIGAARNGNRVDILVGVGGVVWEGLDARVVERFDKDVVAGSRLGDRRGGASGHEIKAIKFEEAELAVVSGGDGTDSFESNRLNHAVDV